MLIEVFQGVENETFLSDMFKTIESINPHYDGINDLWQNDEILLNISSLVGDFMLSKDIWGFAFIISENNQAAIATIDKLLLQSSLFSKIPVDQDMYR